MDMDYLGTFETFEDLPKNISEGKFASTADNNKMYYTDNNSQWQEFIRNDSTIDLNITNYNFNKMALSNMKPLTKKQINESKQLLKEYLHKNSHKYFMLLCHDIKYYTVINIVNEQDLKPGQDLEPGEEVVIQCLEQLGKILSINKTEDEMAIECWVKLENEVIMLMLFNYDAGVELCK